MERAQKAPILRDLQKKMVLLAGPRQVGKTTLAKEIAKEFESSVYLTLSPFRRSAHHFRRGLASFC